MKIQKSCLFIFLFLLTTSIYSKNFLDIVNMAENSCYDCYRAIDNNINIRKEPNLKCEILGQLFENDEIFVNLEKSTDDWFFCYVPKIHKVAYCYKQYFVIKPSLNEDLRKKYYDGDTEIVSEFAKKHYQEIVLDELINVEISKFPEEKCLSIIKNFYESNNFTEGDSSNILIEATKTNYVSVVKYLLSKKDIKEEINVKHNQYAPSLFWAIHRNNIEIVELLLKNGADPNFYTAYSTNAFECINEFIELNIISEEDGLNFKKLLKQYGFNRKEE